MFLAAAVISDLSDKTLKYGIIKSIPSDEYESDGSKNPVILSSDVANGTTGSLKTVLSRTLILTFLALPLLDSASK